MVSLRRSSIWQGFVQVAIDPDPRQGPTLFEYPFSIALAQWSGHQSSIAAFAMSMKFGTWTMPAGLQSWKQVAIDLGNNAAAIGNLVKAVEGRTVG